MPLELQRPVLMLVLKFFNVNTVQARVLERAVSGKSLNLYSSRNVDTRSHDTKDRSLKIAAKIVTKTFYLVSSLSDSSRVSPVHLLLSLLLMCREERKKTVKVAIEMHLLQCQGGWIDLTVFVFAGMFDAFLIDFPYSSQAMTTTMSTKSNKTFSMILTSFFLFLLFFIVRVQSITHESS